MIKIELSPRLANDYLKKINTSSGKYISPSDKLEKWLIDNPHHPRRGVVKYIAENFGTIITEAPHQHQKRIDDFVALGHHKKVFNTTTKKLTALGNEIRDIFNYKGFRDSKKALWIANELSIKSCVYCNTQYALTVEHASKTKMLFHLDHFFPKSVYPWLSLSLYNLIPCCASCNMSKSNNPYRISENIHPYVDSLDEMAKYEADKASLVRFLLDINKNEQEIDLKLSLRNSHAFDRTSQTKLKNYKKDFKSETQYKQFNDVVAETYLKALYHNSHRKKELIKFFEKNTQTTLSTEMINRFIVGNYTDEKDLLKRPLAKMMRDISKDFGLI
jgi:5-methylcytosine-specific restriction endonuclease McrA